MNGTGSLKGDYMSPFFYFFWEVPVNIYQIDDRYVKIAKIS